MSTDRYNVNPLDNAAQMADRLRRMEERLDKLDGGPLVGISAEVKDAAGNPLVIVGTLPDNRRGLLINSETHNWSLTEMTTEGWLEPHISGMGYDPNATKTVVSGSFTPTWGVEFGSALGPGVEVHVPYAIDAGTTAELLVQSNGGAQTVAHSVTGAGNAYVRWLHDLAPGQGPFDLLAQARRSGGAGNVFIYQCRAWVQHPDACSTAGTWV